MGARLTSSQLVTATYASLTIANDLLEHGDTEAAQTVIKRLLYMTERYHGSRVEGTDNGEHN